MFKDYAKHDALGLAEAVRNRVVTAADLLDEAEHRADAAGAVNAIVRRLVPEQGAGPFAGVPYLLKDLGPALAGVPLTQGSRHYATYVPSHDDIFVVRLKAAGLAIFGKTNTPELGQFPYTEPVLHGVCRNPWDLGRTPGGSSGGAAAAVAVGIVPAAHGNDGGGSIRIPASCCGLFGMKPSRGRTLGGADRLAMPGDLNVDHAITRSVRDSAALLDAVSGSDPALPGDPSAPERPYAAEVDAEPGPLRIAVVRGAMFGRIVHPDCRAALDDAAALLRGLGHTVVDADPVDDYPALARAFLVLWSVRTAHYTLSAAAITGRTPRRREFEPSSWAMGMINETHPPGALSAALALQTQVTARLTGFMQGYDAILTPTLAAPPIRIGEQALKASERVALEVLARMPVKSILQAMLKQMAAPAFGWAAFTPLFNMTGQPAMSVPLHWSAAGLPVGIQLAGRFAEDATLFRLAGQLERARPWFDRRPALAAGASP